MEILVYFQSKSSHLCVEKFTLQQLLTATEDKAQLEQLQRKYSELENDYDGEKAAHLEDLKDKAAEIAELSKKYEEKLERVKVQMTEQYEAKIAELTQKLEDSSKMGGEEFKSLKEQLAAVKEENDRMRSGYAPGTAPPKSAVEEAAVSGGPPPPPPPMPGT